MKVICFCLPLLLISPQLVWSDASATMLDLKNKITGEMCRNPAPNAPPCAVQFEAAIQNEIAADEYLWAFSYAVSGKGVKTQKETNAVKETLKRMNSYVLDLTREKISALSYYREKDGKWIPITAEEFHPLALNPRSKLVARFAPDFLSSGSSLRYAPPAAWQMEGLSPATTSTLTFSGSVTRETPIRLEIVNLDELPIPALSIAACRLRSGTEKEAPCDAAGLTLKPGAPFKLALDIKAGRNLKNDQPAFKVVAKAAKAETALLQLAIPFKPQPNYFLFGVTGFLFGGLIAVMMLFMRRKQRAQAAA